MYPEGLPQMPEEGETLRAQSLTHASVFRSIQPRAPSSTEIPSMEKEPHRKDPEAVPFYAP